MGYADYLKQMLSPLGIYRLESGYGAAELDAVGDALDKVRAELDIYLDGSVCTSSSGEYLRLFEALFPIVNFAGTEEERRENILTLLAVNDSWSDKPSLEAMLKACGVEAEIVETDDKFKTELRFTQIRGEPTDDEKQVCKAIMPAHVTLQFVCDGLIWDRAEELFPTWDDLDSAGLTASEIAKLK